VKKRDPVRRPPGVADGADRARVALLIFVLFSVIPGSFASSMGDDGRSVIDAQVMERMNREFGLADPLWVRSANTFCSWHSSISAPLSARASR
jgi:hypothetical protein